MSNQIDIQTRKVLEQQGLEKPKLVGIQGGPGSFNHAAALQHLLNAGVSNFEISYLYTTEGVLSALDDGLIDLG